ncbi:MarR family transcriptional regulator [Ramlibacter albus]|nr:MarR family transcriptional regulator [Ramlibacter albus]
MKKVTIGLGDENDFFERGRRIAKAADSSEVIPEEAVVTFGDPVELVRALTPSRLELVAAVKAKPDSIQGIADRVHRDRSAVRRDLQALIDAGIVLVERRVLPGHGTMKFLQVPAKKVVLQAVL